MAFQNITLEKKEKIGWITINRPEALNVLSMTTLLELESALDEIEKDEKVWVGVLTGSGEKAFCAGADLKEMGKSDLLVRIDHLRLASELKKKRYVTMVQNIEKNIEKKNVKELTKAHDQLLSDTEFPNRTMLLTKISDALHKLTLSQFTLTFEQWQEMWTSISLNHPALTNVLKETLDPPKRKVMRTDQVTLVVYTTCDSSESPVFVEVSGGEDALLIQQELKKQIESWEKE